MRALLLTLCCALVCVLPSPAVSADDELPVDVDIIDLTSVEWIPGDDLPQWVQDLEGRRVRIAGYMHASTKRRSTEFMLVDDSCVCIGSPQPNHFLQVTLVDQETDLRQGLVDVIGTFTSGEVEKDGYVVSLFRLSADVIE